MKNQEHKLVSQMNEGRMISAAQDVIYPMIEIKIAQRLDRICADYRSGKIDHLAGVAYIAALKEIAEELKIKQTQGNKAFEKLNHEGE